MLIDSRLEFSDAQALTSTAASTNVVDLSSDRDIGPGRTMYWIVSVDVASDFTTGDETYVLTLETDSTAAFSSATTLATITLTGAVAAGTKFVQMVPFTNEQFVRVNNTLGGTTPTVTLSSWLSDQEPESWAALPDAI